jgi:hypothetical protein
MIDPTVFSENLLFSAKALPQANVLKPGDKNYFWSRVAFNVYGVEEFRARAGYFETPWNNTSYFPIPDLDQAFDKSFSDIMDQRAVQIFEHARHTDKKIIVMWSGGIDSTCVLASFIKNFSPADLQRVIVCTTLAGVEENPYFYESQIRGRFEMLHWRDLDVCDKFFDKHILLHGDPGDCLFGPSVLKYQPLWEDNKYMLPWRTNQAILHHLYYDPTCPEFAGWWVNKISGNLLRLQNQGKFTNIISISDWHWWNYYNLKWQGSMTRALVSNKKNHKEKISRSHIQEFFDMTFFAHDNFQIWSYQNLHEVLSQGLKNHKKHAKNYIYELDGNDHYHANKTKMSSVVNVWRYPLIIDHDAVHYYHTEPAVLEKLKQVLNS